MKRRNIFSQCMLRGGCCEHPVFSWVGRRRNASGRSDGRLGWSQTEFQADWNSGCRRRDSVYPQMEDRGQSTSSSAMSSLLPRFQAVSAALAPAWTVPSRSGPLGAGGGAGVPVWASGSKASGTSYSVCLVVREREDGTLPASPACLTASSASGGAGGLFAGMVITDKNRAWLASAKT